MTQTKKLPADVSMSLEREASMSAMAIGAGLTDIRKYDFACHGYFYSGILSFTSGIERLLKIILIYDYRLKNKDAFPNNNYIKSNLHYIDKLIKKAREINTTLSLGVSDSFLDQDSIYENIISFLTKYANQSRYYNLDYLTNKKQQGLEPLASWDKEVCSVIIKRHYKLKKQKIEQKKKLAAIMDQVSMVQHTQEDGTEISNMNAFLRQGDMIPTKQKFSMYYLYTIARFLRGICAELEYRGNFYPCLREFFAIYGVEDRTYILSRKTWDPMRP